MKEFFRDYGALWKESGAFMKKHWRGTLLFTGVLGLVGTAIEATIIEPEWPIWIWEKITDIFSAIFHKE